MMIHKVLGLLLAALIAAIAVTHAAEIETDGDVLVLTDDNFEAALEKHPMLLVEFYAPWCGHCKKLEPEYSAAAAELKKDNLFIAKVDATEATELAGKHGIRGFPTLKLFKNGNVIEYEGGRTKDAIVSYMHKKTGPPAKTLTTAAELTDFKASAEAVVFGYFTDLESAAAKLFMEVAGKDDSTPYAITSTAAVGKEAGVKAGELAVLKSFDEGKNTITVSAEADAESLIEFVQTYTTRLLTVFSPESSAKIFGGKIQVHLLLFADDADDSNKSVMEQVTKVAADMRSQIIHVLVPPSEERVYQYFGLTKEDTPTVMLGDMRTDMKKYKYEGEIKQKPLLKFEKDFFDGKLKPALKSEEPSEEDLAEPVKVIKGKSFGPLVMDSKKDVLLEFYAPWCGHCKALSPKYDELATRLAHEEHIMIAKMDATENEIDHPNVSVKGFPTIYFFPAEDKANPETYEGPREVDGFLEYLKEKVSKPFKAAEGSAALEEEDDEEEEDAAKEEL